MLGMLMVAQVILEQPAPTRTIGPILPSSSRITAPCPPKDDPNGDIVVCGTIDSAQYRLRPLGPPPNGKPLPPMTAKLGSGTIDGRAVEHCVGQFCAPAAMATLKLPF